MLKGSRVHIVRISRASQHSPFVAASLEIVATIMVKLQIVAFLAPALFLRTTMDRLPFETAKVDISKTCNGPQIVTLLAVAVILGGQATILKSLLQLMCQML